jgi:asparagine synthase (glutamine-hydrolysing)
MCGIAGAIAWEAPWPTESLIRAMCEVICHRGPDDEGVYTAGPVGIGMRRLSIIDVAGGHQPIFNESGEIAIVFNGEIYNYRELRSWLEGRGHRFTTETDTEVVLHLYEEKGEWCVRELRGMFAFAVWDSRRQALVLARDRFGEKPLYYATPKGGLVFASELKALLVHPAVGRELDPEGINQFLTFGNTLGETTILQEARKLPPAHVLVASRGSVRVSRYWQWRVQEDSSLSETQIIEHLRELLQEAVRLQLVSEVPLGAFLSGGLDSSTVVALMSKASPRPVKTFSIGFGDPQFDELNHCRTVAAAFGTEHQELVLDPDAVEVLADLVWHVDEPFADSSAIPTYFLSKLARENVTVALSGDGGDELFAGYPGYHAEIYLNGMRRIPRRLRAWALERAISPLTEWARGSVRWKMERLRRNLLRVDMSPEDRFLSRHCLFPVELRSEVLTDHAQKLLAPTDHPGNWVKLDFHGNQHPVNKSMYLDINVYLPNDMLVKVDRMSMAHSLEVRCPLLDHKLAEFMGTVPSRHKVRSGRTKYILRKAMAGILPDSILSRGKQGFRVPLDRWFKCGLVALAREVLLDPRSVRRGLVDSKGVETLLMRHEQGMTANGEQIWALLVLETWCRLFLDPPRTGQL